jgi:hypothetical protein
MSKKENKNVGRKPDFIAYTVRNSKDGNGHWNKVGAAWEHRDGRGMDIQLDSIPLDGRLTIRELREERMKAYEGERQEAHTEQNNTRRKGHGRERVH